MTEKQMSELLIEILDDSDSKERERKKMNRRVRRKNDIKKFKARYKIVTETGHDRIGYVDYDYIYQENRIVYHGKYIKYPKNSNLKRWCKTTSNHCVRKSDDVPAKGNYYRKIFKYYWWYLD